MTSSRPPFSFLLPLLCVLLWVCLVAVPITLTYVHLMRTSNGAPSARVSLAHLTLTVPRNEFLSFAASSTLPYEPVLKIAGLPGVAFDLLTSRLASTWPENFAPGGMDTQAWQAISYPVYSLPFWCFVGLGLDRLLGRKALNWPALLFGSLLCAFCVLCAAVGLLDRGPNREDGSYVLGAFWVWAVLFGVFPLGWLTQWRRGRTAQSRTQLQAPCRVPRP